MASYPSGSLRKQRRQRRNTLGRYAQQFPPLASIQRGPAEAKYISSTVSPVFNSTGQIVDLGSQIAQGDGVNQRSGNMVISAKLEIRGVINRSAAAGATQYEKLRIIVFRTKYSGTPNITDVLDSVSPLSPYNVAFIGQGPADMRLEVIHDSLFTLDLYHPVIPWTYNFTPPAFDNTIRFDSAVAAPPVVNGIYLLVIGNFAANSPTSDFTFRHYFTDR